ncbi:unnamed protein product [Caenorhabditis bovis]|uniref:Uncharacterized protein n=1 Tax=Caenorhabditis bovis TaxID=2654633 RepID=A0A8S1F5U2_9PELO|nr:unnamed protein product [Caenorhabditis bovis]
MDLSDEQIRALPHNELIAQFLQMKEEFIDYQTSSSEIEKMLDAEVDDLKNRLKRAETRLQQATTECERNKARHEEARAQSAQLEEQLRRENATLREKCEQQRETIRKLEQKNDKLEMSERNKEFMTMDLGGKLDSAIEKIAILESQLYERQLAAEEMHRLREERTERPRLVVEPLREVKNELMVAGTSKSQGPSTEVDDVTMEDVEDKKQQQSHANDICMEEAMTRMDECRIGTTSNDKKSRFQDRRASSASGCVNRILKDVMSKVERLETLLSTIRVSQPSTKPIIAS